MQCKFCAAQAAPGYVTCGGSTCVVLQASSSLSEEIFSVSIPFHYYGGVAGMGQTKAEPAKLYLDELKDKRAALAKSISAQERELAICVALIDFLEQRPDAGEIVKELVKGLVG